MKKKTKHFLAALSALFLLSSAYGFLSGGAKTASAEMPARNVADVVGVTTAGGYYEFDPTVSSLEDGANQVKALGTNVIKLWLASSVTTTSYAYNVDWTA